MPKKSTLLIIDDDADVRDSIVEYLVGSGFSVIKAQNGEEGLALYKKNSPDLVLCDLRMPKLDGLAVLKKIRILSPHVPFIVVSGAGVMSDVVEALRLGASDYIVKPIGDLEVLEHAINRAIRSAQLAKENQKYRKKLETAVKKLKLSLEELQSDHNVGREVQKRMLPPASCEIGDYCLYHQIYPSLYLSGDFVDYFKLGTYRFAFYLADVSGHGASSAFVTVLLKHMSMELKVDYLKNHLDEPAYPSKFLHYINRSLLNTGLGKHVTMFGGVVDLRNNQLTYAFGGHFPMPIITINGKSKFLEGRGLPVGLFEDVVYKDNHMELPEEFSLTIFSDGILEVFGDMKLSDKEKHILGVVDGCAGDIETLKHKLGLEMIKEAPDDIAILVLSRKVL